MTNFAKYAAEARARGNYSLARRIETEGKICRKLVKRALAWKYVVSVSNGEEWIVRQSNHLNEIMAALFETDSDTITIRDPARTMPDHPKLGAKVGTVALIYGNDGNDVISDWSAPDLEAFTAWLEPVTKYAETL